MTPSAADHYRFDTARQDAVVAALDASPLTGLRRAPDPDDGCKSAPPAPTWSRHNSLQPPEPELNKPWPEGWMAISYGRAAAAGAKPSSLHDS